ncbi:MAG: N-methyl-L-tryptophan oxidase [Candidatus Eremiobacteraeota bacterium]|nr:N-methyl-L-tryptophan oxidase [Candidatus Eremiobacteraeota bacterium]
MRYDAIVAGLGGMGGAIAAHASAGGLRVLGLDRFPRGHDLGASSGGARMIRRAYFERPAYVPRVERAYELWHDLETRTGAQLLFPCGVLLAGHPDSAILAGALESAARHGVPIERLDAADIARRFAAFRPRADEAGVFEPGAGFLIAERATAAHLAMAEAHGADLRFECAVAGWEASDAGVRVRVASGETFEAGKLALAFGPWFDGFANDLGVELRIQRNVQCLFDAAEPRFAPGAMPGFLVDRAEYPAPLYGFPNFGAGLKAAFHGFGATTRADELDRFLSAADAEPLREHLDAWVPGAASHAAGGKVCMYALTPDEDFAIGAHPDLPNVVVAGGFSGHGFKFASVVGEIGADLLINGATHHDIAFLSPSRFAAAR